MKKVIDYSITPVYFYRFVCNDPNIHNIYVGSSINLTRRKSEHKNDCNNPNRKGYNFLVYKIIRENGGWENWRLLEIEHKIVKDKTESKQREQYWIEFYNAQMNMLKLNFNRQEYTLQYNKQYREQHCEEIKAQQRKYREQHMEQIVEYNNQHREKIKEWRLEYKKQNPEKIKAQRRKYREQHMEQIVEYNNQHREKIKEWRLEYKKQNPEKIKATHRKYRENNREKINANNRDRRLRIKEQKKMEIEDINVNTI